MEERGVNAGPGKSTIYLVECKEPLREVARIGELASQLFTSTNGQGGRGASYEISPPLCSCVRFWTRFDVLGTQLGWELSSKKAKSASVIIFNARLDEEGLQGVAGLVVAEDAGRL